jgi:hypothetical protein
VDSLDLLMSLIQDFVCVCRGHILSIGGDALNELDSCELSDDDNWVL